MGMSLQDSAPPSSRLASASTASHHDALPEDNHQLIVMELRSSMDEARTARRSGGPERTGRKPQPVPGSLLHCRIHGYGTHATDHFCARQTRKHRSNSEAADVYPAHPTQAADVHPAHPTKSSQAGSSTVTRTVTCCKRHEVGHYANDCPRKASSREAAGLKRITVDGEAARTVARSSSDRSKSAFDLGTTLEPRHGSITVLLNRQSHTAQTDLVPPVRSSTNAFASDIGATLEPRHGSIEFAGPTSSRPHTGITSPNRLRIGPVDILHQCEVMPTTPGKVTRRRQYRLARAQQLRINAKATIDSYRKRRGSPAATTVSN